MLNKLFSSSHKGSMLLVSSPFIYLNFGANSLIDGIRFCTSIPLCLQPLPLLIVIMAPSRISRNKAPSAKARTNATAIRLAAVRPTSDIAILDSQASRASKHQINRSLSSSKQMQQIKHNLIGIECMHERRARKIIILLNIIIDDIVFQSLSVKFFSFSKTFLYRSNRS